MSGDPFSLIQGTTSSQAIIHQRRWPSRWYLWPERIFVSEWDNVGPQSTHSIITVASAKCLRDQQPRSNRRAGGSRRRALTTGGTGRCLSPLRCGHHLAVGASARNRAVMTCQIIGRAEDRSDFDRLNAHRSPISYCFLDHPHGPT